MRISGRSCRSRSTTTKPVRIGVNWGSLDQDLLTEMMDENAQQPDPLDAHFVYVEAMLASALRSAELAEEVGLRHEAIIISAKVSGVTELVDVYRRLASRCDYPLHLGLTEAGMGTKGVVASSAALAILLSEGIGDTIRVSLTPRPNGDRTEEVLVAQQILQSLGLRSFAPQVTACPGLWPHDLDIFQQMAGRDIQGYLREQMPGWRGRYGVGVEEMRVAVDGVRGQRVLEKSKLTCQYRDFTPRHGRGPSGAGVRRRGSCLRRLQRRGRSSRSSWESSSDTSRSDTEQPWRARPRSGASGFSALVLTAQLLKGIAAASSAKHDGFVEKPTS